MSTQKNFFVIVNYNSGSHIISAIESIYSSQNIQPHIVIVDNASHDNSLENCRSRFPSIAYITNTKNVGFSAGVNIGIQYALKNNAYTVTLLNPDALLHKQCMSTILHSMKKDGIAIISPVIYKYKTDTLWFSGGFIDFWRMRAVHRSPKNLSIPLPKNSFISGCVMTISRDVFEKIGLFDEDFFLYYEDADFSLRAQRNGFAIAIIENAHAFHKEVSEEKKENKTYFLVLSGLLFFSKHTKNLRRVYFNIHYTLRKIKNFFDRKKKSPFSEIVHRAFIDFEKQK